jgi:hypothetical protein
MSSRSGDLARTGRRLAGALAGLALCATAAGVEIPRSKRSIDLDVVPGAMGAVHFEHAAHAAVGWRADRSLMTCRDCHHTLAGDEPASLSEDLRCSGCHPAVGEPDRIVGGRPARAMARLKPDGAIDFKTILFHDYCRDCHKKVQGGELRLSHCKACHPKGVGAGALHGRFDGVRQAGTHLSWLRCPAGQRWSSKGCEGEAALASRALAAGTCPEGCRLPSREEFLGLLEGCVPSAAGGGEAHCRSCAESQACSQLLGPDAGTYWVASQPGAPGRLARLSDGAFLVAPEDARALVRCVQTAR